MIFKDAEPHSAWGRNGAFKPHSAVVTPLSATKAHPAQVALQVYSKRSAGGSAPISVEMSPTDAMGLAGELMGAVFHSIAPPPATDALLRIVKGKRS